MCVVCEEADPFTNEDTGTSDFGCLIQTTETLAEDDEQYADLKEALRMVVAMWNRRPHIPVDSAVADMVTPKMRFFSCKEEAREYFKERQKFEDAEHLVGMAVLD